MRLVRREYNLNSNILGMSGCYEELFGRNAA
jgi:hypothetical protein